MKMSDSERLILEVEKRPCLWQTASEDYSRREIKDKAWEEVCRELYPQCEDYFEIQKQVADLKKKWVNIRAYYRKEMLARKEDKNGQTNVKRKKYVFADILHFLDPVLDNKDLEDTNDNCFEENNIDVNDDEKKFIDPPKDKVRTKNNLQTSLRLLKSVRNINNPTKVRKNAKKTEFDITSPPLPLPITIPTVNIKDDMDNENVQKFMKPKKFEPGNNNINNNVEGEILNILKIIQQSPQYNKELDPDSSFLLSLVPDMKSLTDMQKIQFKTGIFLLLNQLKFSNSNINLHSPSPIPFAKTQFNFPFYNSWSHYIQEQQNNTSVNSLPSSLNVSPPLPSSSTATPTVSNPSSLYQRDTTGSGSAFSPAPCTPISKNYH